MSPSHVDDVAAATLAPVRTAAPHGLYHRVGSGHATWLEVAAALAGELGVEPAIRGVTLDELKLRAPASARCRTASSRRPGWRCRTGGTRWRATRDCEGRTSGDVGNLRSDVREMGKRVRNVEIQFAKVDQRLLTLERAIIPAADSDE